MLNGTTSQYISSLANGDLPDVLPYGIHDKDDSGSDDDSDIDDDGGPLSTPQALAQVTLAIMCGCRTCTMILQLSLTHVAETTQLVWMVLLPISMNLVFLWPSNN